MKNLVNKMKFTVSNFGSCRDEMSWFMVQNILTLRCFPKFNLMPSFVDFGELLRMLSLDKTYPYLGLELKAHSSFYFMR